MHTQLGQSIPAAGASSRLEALLPGSDRAESGHPVPDSLAGAVVLSPEPDPTVSRNCGPCCHIEGYPQDTAARNEEYSNRCAQKVCGTAMTAFGGILLGVSNPIAGGLSLCCGLNLCARGMGVRLGSIPYSLPDAPPAQQLMQ